MKSDQSLSATRQLHVVALGLLAMATALPASADNATNDTDTDTYTWSAELIEVDQPDSTVTVQSWVVSDADVDFDALHKGDRVTLTWSGINTAAGVRGIARGNAPAADSLTLPIEFVSPQLDERYVRFKVAVPREDLAKLATLQPGSWVTATSRRHAKQFEEAVADLRPYNDVG
jgi:hypothetical protein